MVILKIFKLLLKIASWICYVLIGLYFLVSAPVFVGYTPLIVLSGSMSPTYVVGDVIYYKKVNPEDLEKMDIITFESGENSYVTHRIVDIVDGEYQTKGDASLSPDAELVKYDEIKGEVVKYHLPIIGHYIKFVNEHLQLVIVVVIILVSEFFIDNMKAFDINKKTKERSLKDEK